MSRPKDSGLGANPSLIRLDECGSTNTELLRLAESGAEPFTAIVARHQTAGRGRAGHGWTAPPGSSLLLSVLLRPRVAPETLPLTTLAVGLAVCEAIHETTGLPAGIKWPNDILIHGRKCAGILCEGVSETVNDVNDMNPVEVDRRAGRRMLPGIVAGIGINVTTPSDALPFRPIFPATSLALEGASVDAETLLEPVLAAIRRWTAVLESEYGPSEVVSRFRERDALRGRRLCVDLPDGRHIKGDNLGISESGALRLETDMGPFDVLAGSVGLA